MARCARIPKGVTGREADPNLWMYNKDLRKHHGSTGGKTKCGAGAASATPRGGHRVDKETGKLRPLFPDPESAVFSITAEDIVEPPLPLRPESYWQEVRDGESSVASIGDTMEEYDLAFREEFGADLRGEAGRDQDEDIKHATGYDEEHSVEKDLHEDLFAEIFGDFVARRAEHERDGTVVRWDSALEDNSKVDPTAVEQNLKIEITGTEANIKDEPTSPFHRPRRSRGIQHAVFNPHH